MTVDITIRNFLGRKYSTTICSMLWPRIPPSMEKSLGDHSLSLKLGTKRDSSLNKCWKIYSHYIKINMNYSWNFFMLGSLISDIFWTKPKQFGFLRDLNLSLWISTKLPWSRSTPSTLCGLTLLPGEKLLKKKMDLVFHGFCKLSRILKILKKSWTLLLKLYQSLLRIIILNDWYLIALYNASTVLKKETTYKFLWKLSILVSAKIEIWLRL